jgi:hypothetical protein
MWLDRLSGHSTPSGSPPPSTTHSRSFSPAPRRSGHLAPTTTGQRPGFNPRSSSLSLVSNDSTASLLASSRRANGSGLKQSITVPDTPEPFEVLEKLLGAESTGLSGQAHPVLAENVVLNGTDKLDLESDLDFGGLSLHELVAEESSTAQDIHVHRAQAIEECMYKSYPISCTPAHILA